ncbi:lysozyme [Shewanella surugensis]|uniref:Lysozyme n=1 Tax=Shewanella surugensis TaxID=212020 RepID=A0ABT0L6T6_9GAMM|nr:lysozyme [Shewanella surugensis]MCL1123404.1 lysozyme [Shewanella surugensis]
MKIGQRLLMFGFASAVAAGGTLIAQHEGQVLSTYVDPVGILTSCYGHTGKDVSAEQEFSEQECLEQLATDLSQFNYKLMALTHPVTLTDGEHGAYLSFIYNVGEYAFRDSTLRKKLHAGDKRGACDELLRWVYAGGRKLNGLINRRTSERQLCVRDLNVQSI